MGGAGSRKAPAVVISDANRVQMTGNTIEGHEPAAADARLVFDGVTLLQCNDNLIDGMGLGSAPGIVVRGASAGAQVRGNLLAGVASGTDTPDGVSVAPSVTNAQVDGNLITLMTAHDCALGGARCF